jgi:hypothetical protein
MREFGFISLGRIRVSLDFEKNEEIDTYENAKKRKQLFYHIRNTC